MVQNAELIAKHLGQETFSFEGKSFKLEQFIVLLEESIKQAKSGDRALQNALITQFPKLLTNVEGIQEAHPTPLWLIGLGLEQKQKLQTQSYPIKKLTPKMKIIGEEVIEAFAPPLPNKIENKNVAYNAKRQLFKDIFINNTDPKIKTALELLEEHGEIRLDLVRKYLAGERTSIAKIASEVRLNRHWIEREILVILCLMGWPNKSEQINNEAMRLLGRAEKIKATKAGAPVN
jgi:hypothetical protein